MSGEVQSAAWEAIAHFGPRAQYKKAIEELCELSAVIARTLNEDRPDLEAELIDEAADVQIMLEQIKIMVGWGRVANRITEKKIRLLKRIAGEKAQRSREEASDV